MRICLSNRSAYKALNNGCVSVIEINVVKLQNISCAVLLRISRGVGHPHDAAAAVPCNNCMLSTLYT